MGAFLFVLIIFGVSLACMAMDWHTKALAYEPEPPPDSKSYFSALTRLLLFSFLPKHILKRLKCA